MSSALDLLAEAHHSLREDVAPCLGGEARRSVLLAANAIAIARRETALGARLAESRAGLPSDPGAIRNGAHDDDLALYGRLLCAAVQRAYVADPAAVTDEERRRWLEDVDR